MERDELYKIVDAILNKATNDDVEVIKAALERRSGEGEPGFLRVSPKKLADTVAHSVADQISYSKDTIRNMIRNYAVDIIRKEAPELSDEQVRELLHAWIPDPEGGLRQSAAEKRREEVDDDYDSAIPKDMLVTMIEQFLVYSEGNMPVREQALLRRAMPDWQKKYWEKFPPKIKDGLSLYLKGTIDRETLWLDIHKVLNL
ncbi:MAG: hypothetical protein ACP5IA_01500 [Sediminispirochaetaceae bacterium]